MIYFNLNIDLFFENEADANSYIKAITCIEYPILHIIAKTLENSEEEYDLIDRFILKAALINPINCIQTLAGLTGIKKELFEYRSNELEKQGLITYDGSGNINLLHDGIEYISNEHFPRYVHKTRSFLLDGITHEPLLRFFIMKVKST